MAIAHTDTVGNTPWRVTDRTWHAAFAMQKKGFVNCKTYSTLRLGGPLGSSRGAAWSIGSAIVGCGGSECHWEKC
eukprot:1156288-Pelagomonas_calceolata.AAC.6